MGMGTHTWVGGPLAIRPLPPLRKGVESREAWVDTLEPAARPFQPFSLSSHQPSRPHGLHPQYLPASNGMKTIHQNIQKGFDKFVQIAFQIFRASA